MKLDSLIDVKPSIHACQEAKIDSLRRKVAQTEDLWERYALYGSLFYEYLHYQADSSFYYVGKKAEMLPMLHNPDLYNEVLINRAEVYCVMGLRLETEQTLKAVQGDIMSPGMRLYYYATCCSHYTSMAEYVGGLYGGKLYAQKASAYRDSILMLLPPDVDHDIVFSEQLLQTQAPAVVIERLQKLLSKTTDSRQRTYLHYTLSEAYRVKGDTANLVYHLAQTAVLDLQASVREYAALQKLAWLLFKHGDTEHAFKYVSCSMEDALACSARLRSMESSNFNAIIHRTIGEMRNKEHESAKRLLLVDTLLIVLLVLIMVGLIRWAKKMAMMRNSLAVANQKLEDSNHELTLTSKIKEAYIAHYLDRCVNYLEQMEQNRRSLEKLAMSSKIDELFKTIRSTAFLHNERKKFYEEFDRSFLELFPNFVDKFNDLLVDEERVQPKPGELLSTELRIFALIRLGITDSARIAHFLGYSLTTIYNYRSKLRNKSKGAKENFEQQVMEL